ncbi:calcium-binding protein [Streptomyces sp. Ru72]|uniref:calcium-binding protein n=1 Tax=Streptomyces sp. Ru72 TaxID=2080747 RepID=UPI000CDDDD9E|nr:calcium-binding protein [Streptomyces sp. Ru72]POX50791.1 calcium-binding protein [Streptomyces sp. Ru72]
MTPSLLRPRRRVPLPAGRRGRVVTLSLALALTAVAALTLSRCGGDGTPPPRPWVDGSTHGRWLSVFNGHGTNVGDDHSLSLSPKAAEDPGTTHAGLVVSTASYTDVRYEARMRAVRQLRAVKPNPWEVPWLVWAYTDPGHFYYITLKPNGWELGKRDPAYPGGQRFLATGRTTYPVGDWYDVRVEQRGPVLTVAVGGKPLVTFTDEERPYLRGRVGAYTEDATVRFEGLEASSGR